MIWPQVMFDLRARNEHTYLFCWYGDDDVAIGFSELNNYLRLCLASLFLSLSLTGYIWNENTSSLSHQSRQQPTTNNAPTSPNTSKNWRSNRVFGSSRPSPPQLTAPPRKSKTNTICEKTKSKQVVRLKWRQGGRGAHCATADRTSACASLSRLDLWWMNEWMQNDKTWEDST